MFAPENGGQAWFAANAALSLLFLGGAFASVWMLFNMSNNATAFSGTLLGVVLIGWSGPEGTPEAPILMLTIVSILLCVGTFWVGDDDALRKWWGMRLQLTARQYRESSMIRKVQALAAAYDLTDREAEIVVLFAQNQTAGTIKTNLYLSEGTVRNYIQSVYKKTGVHSRKELQRLLDAVGDS